MNLTVKQRLALLVELEAIRAELAEQRGMLRALIKHTRAPRR